MRSKAAQDKMEKEQVRRVEKVRGLPRTTSGFSSLSFVETTVPMVQKLPAVVSEEAIQNEDGSFVTIEGYND